MIGPLRLIKKINSRIKKLALLIARKVKESIRLELMLTFAACFILAMLCAILLGSFISHNVSSARIDYRQGIQAITYKAKEIADDLINSNASIKDSGLIKNYISDTSSSDSKIKIIVSDLDGNVLYKSDNVDETKVDIYSLIKQSINLSEKTYNERQDHERIEENEEYVCFFPISFRDSNNYLIIRGIPEGSIVYDNGNSALISVLFGVFMFIVLFYIFTKSKMKYIEEIANGLTEISKGNLKFKVAEKGHDELESLAERINYMSDELNQKIENERMLERSKNELITNVSHDLKTPLTSIKGYLGLIKERRYKNENELDDFVKIAYNKSEKLESLIRDLFEYTKLTSSEIKLDKSDISLNGLLEQLIDEFAPLCEENDTTIKQQLPKEKIIVNADGSKMVRVFENLLANAIRYGIKPGDILVRLYKDHDKAVVTVENECEYMNEEDVNRLFERFYRVEKSRSQETGGSGLGLAIAKNIVELHNGEIKVEYKENKIIFTVII